MSINFTESEMEMWNWMMSSKKYSTALLFIMLKEGIEA
jgi:hypothetical protein